MAREQGAEGEAAAGPAERPAGGAAPADVERVAERVYRLMLAEARLERSRAGALGGGRGAA